MAVYKSKKSTKDGRQYFFRIKYKDILGNVHDYTSPKFKNKKDAENEEAIYRIKVNKQETYAASSITIEMAFHEWINEKSKELKKQSVIKINVMYRYLNQIKNTKINDLNVAKYKSLVSYIENLNYSANYCNKIIGILKRIIIYSNKYYNTSDNILKYIIPFKEANKFKEEMKFFTYEEYLKFDNAIDNFEYHVFFEILYFLGLRKGECQALTWNDIDFNKNKLSVNKTLTTKIKGELWTISTPKTKNSIRVLPMPKKLLNDLKRLNNEASKYKDYNNSWFVFGKIKPFSETTITYNKNKYCQSANVQTIRVHDFRHSCASLLISKGATPVLVSKYLGHANISITLNTYTHLFKSELEQMTEILNQL